MKIAIGIDVGISTTKIVGIRNGEVVRPLRIKATDPLTSLYGAFGKYLYDNKIELSDVGKVMLTGVGSAYIDKLDSYRKHIYRLVTGNKRTELLSTLKSQELVDRELEAFYASFDETFLGLFPTFVDDFNALLKPNEKIVPKQPGHLSTDLRIFALIRLGVKENELICSFLRCSKATVYAYRSRVRLKSMEPEKFDEMVLNL